MIYVLYMLNVPVPAVRQAERLCAFKKKRFASVCRPVTRARGPPYSTSLPYGESLASRLSRYTKAERINNVKTTSKNDNEQNIHEPRATKMRRLLACPTAPCVHTPFTYITHSPSVNSIPERSPGKGEAPSIRSGLSAGKHAVHTARAAARGEP